VIIDQIIEICEKIFVGSIVTKLDLPSKSIRIDFPKELTTRFVALIWFEDKNNERLIYCELKLDRILEDREPFVFFLNKSFGEERWYFKEKIEKFTKGFYEFILSWFLELTLVEIKKMRLVERYIEIRKNPITEFRIWKIDKLM
jgi:hypothetical protein